MYQLENKRYDPDMQPCNWNTHWKPTMTESSKGGYLDIEELIVKGCSNEKEKCPFYRTVAEGYHECGFTEERKCDIGDLACPFYDILNQ